VRRSELGGADGAHIAVDLSDDEVGPQVGQLGLVDAVQGLAQPQLAVDQTIDRDGQETSLSPMIEPMSVVRKATRQNVVGSLKTSIPIAAVPKAPSPVHTA